MAAVTADGFLSSLVEARAESLKRREHLSKPLGLGRNKIIEISLSDPLLTEWSDRIAFSGTALLRRLLVKLADAGKQRAPTDRSYPARAAAKSKAKLPPYIQEALKKNPAARRYFESLAPSYRRNYVGWIDSAKQEETKRRRLDEAIRLLAAGQKLGLK